MVEKTLSGIAKIATMNKNSNVYTLKKLAKKKVCPQMISSNKIIQF
jgi:hypothetical protein